MVGFEATVPAPAAALAGAGGAATLPDFAAVGDGGQRLEHRQIAVAFVDADETRGGLDLDDGTQRPRLMDSRRVEQRRIAERDRRDADVPDGVRGGHAEALGSSRVH